MNILVDADACPVKSIILRHARARELPVVMFIDTSHVLSDGYSQVVTVDKARDSADFALTARVRPGDLVVTQDFGLAAMVLAKGGRALNQNGLVFSGENIGALLEERAFSQKIRRGGGRTSGPKKRTRENDEAFERAFVALLDAPQR